MDCRTQKAQRAAQGDSSTQRGVGADPYPAPATESGATLIAGRALVQTVRHFFPEFNAWLDGLPDTRVQDACIYSRRFLAWWGPRVLANFNRLAETEQISLPVHDTLDHFVGHVKLKGWERLRNQAVQRLLRMKALDAARLQGRYVLLLDATGLICFHRRHCPYCLVQRHGQQTLYLHHVLEAKLLGPGGVVLSVDSEFIENADAGNTAGRSADEIKQDCELKALQRLAPRVKKTLPQLRIVLAIDNLYACGPAFALTQELDWDLVVTFKEGRTPALWREYQALRAVCPENALRLPWADRVQEFRWVNQLDYEDSARRAWKLQALECTETTADGQQYFAWLTTLPVNRKTVAEIAEKGGRYRWKIENEGFNRQKNSGLNLEHVYSTDPEKWKVYYLLLQIAFILVQLLERGSLLRRLAAEVGRPVWKLFGSLKNVSRRLLESLRFLEWEETWFDRAQAAKVRIGFDSS